MFRLWKPLVCILLLSSVTWSADPPKAVARILELKGSVVIKNATGKPRPAVVFGTVFEGDTLAVTEGAVAVLVFRQDGHAERLKVARSFTASAQGCGPKGDVETVMTNARRQMLVAKGLQRLPELGLMDAISIPRSGPSQIVPPRISPIHGATLLTQTPVFTWPAAEQAAEYSVVVFNGNLRHWSASAAKSELTYAGPVLKPSRTYRWEVVAKSSGKVQTIGQGEFTIATADQISEAQEIKELAVGEDVMGLALAALSYERLGLFAEALSVYERLAKLAPETSPFHAALADLYEKAGRQDDSVQARARAEKLGFEFKKSIS